MTAKAVLAALVLAAALGLLATVIVVARTRPRPCTHGASSIGPVSINGGGKVRGSTRPTTERCLP